MLVLTRKQRESVVIGGGSSLQAGLTVTVLEIRNGKVKLGFEADRGIVIHRSEIVQRIRLADVPQKHSEDHAASTER
ncbi:MAG: carbon storage regulator [Planctomycetia bacterium]|nr:carbon storage regulator [Planctomycetia bacterium]